MYRLLYNYLYLKLYHIHVHVYVIVINCIVIMLKLITADNYFDNFYVCHEIITTYAITNNIFFLNDLIVCYVCSHMPLIQRRKLNIRPNRCDNLVAHIGLLFN